MIIGSFQSLRNEVDPAGVERHGVNVVRRISGGGAMFAEPSSTITYSLAVPQSLVSGLSFADSYAYLDDWVLEALADMGIKAWYQPLNDIATEVGKIAGAAQKRMVGPDGGPGAVLHHVTMAYDIDADKMLEVLRIGKEKMSDKGTRSAKKRVDPLQPADGPPAPDRHRTHDRVIPQASRPLRGKRDGRRTGTRRGTRTHQVRYAGVDGPGAVGTSRAPRGVPRAGRVARSPGCRTSAAARR